MRQAFRSTGLKREELIATNSMLLHELYFGSLGGDGATMAPAMALALEANFGSVERWRAEFMAMGKALGGGSGWVLLTFLPREGTLVNQWAADHTDALAGGVPILALDMYEHAYHLDYGAAAGAYVDAFMTNIDWAQVYERYQAAVHGASEPFAAAQDDLRDAQVLDVRRAGMFEKAEAMSRGPSGATLRQSGMGARPARGPGNRGLLRLWSRSRDGRRRFGCEPPGCRRASCAAASTPGRQRVCRLAPRAPCHESAMHIRPPRPRFDIWSGS